MFSRVVWTSLGRVDVFGTHVPEASRLDPAGHLVFLVDETDFLAVFFLAVLMHNPEALSRLDPGGHRGGMVTLVYILF